MPIFTRVVDTWYVNYLLLHEKQNTAGVMKVTEPRVSHPPVDSPGLNHIEVITGFPRIGRAEGLRPPKAQDTYIIASATLH